MKKKLSAPLLAGLMIGIFGTANAALLAPVSVSGTGTFSNIDYMTDGIIPSEGSYWRGDTTWWYYTPPQFTVDYGGIFLIEDIVVSVDNNDYYRIEYSLDFTNWNVLTAIDAWDGEIYGGMDTMSSVSGDSEYLAAIDFNGVTAQYLRIFATDGDSQYAVGELQAYGTSPIPEPATMLLFGVGMAGLVGRKLRKAKKIGEGMGMC